MSSLRLAAALLVFSMVAGSAYAQTAQQLADDAKIIGTLNKYKCGEAQIGVCTKLIEDNKEKDCDTTKKAAQCFFDKCPGIKGTEDAQPLAEAMARESGYCNLQPNEIINGENNAQTAFELADDAKIRAILTKYKCDQAQIEVCRKPLEDEKDCDTMKKAAQCVFVKCPGIKGSEDAQPLAEAIARESGYCNLKPNEIINGENSAPGSLNRNVGTVIGFALVTALVKIFFY